MSTWAWVLVGAGAWCVLGMIVGTCIDEEIRSGLLRLALAAFTLPTLFIVNVGLRLPKFTRRRVTPDSLVEEIQRGRYGDRTVAMNWPGGALVLLRSKRCERPGCDIRRRHRHEPIEVRQS